jgi:hypothetical protein
VHIIREHGPPGSTLTSMWLRPAAAA